MNQLSEEEFIKEVCLRLDRSIASLDLNIESRLTAARVSALSLEPDLSGNDQQLEDDFLLEGVLNTLEENQSVSPEIEHKLDQIRHRAIAQLAEQETNPNPLAFLNDLLERGKEFIYSSFNVPVGMIATACLTVTVVTLFYSNTNQDGFAPIDDESLLVASAEDFELYENLDFYLWLEELEQTN